MGIYAQEFVEALPNIAGDTAYVVGLRGNLGAGKTTFVQAVAKELGVKEAITSPTFVIAQSYDIQHTIYKKLIHMDAYRLTPLEPDTIGFGAALADPSNLILVEWPENLPTVIQREVAGMPVLKFETVDETTRRVTKE
jgi:tRNA threonylcarbamoyladenosine biosynthesis protein TsaE